MTLDEYQVLTRSPLFKAVYSESNHWIDVIYYSHQFRQNLFERGSEIVLEGDFASIWIGSFHVETIQKNDIVEIRLVEKR